MLVDSQGRLTGIFTDSDLARLFESTREQELDSPISQLMTKRPATLPIGSMLGEAVELMARRKISELPIVDAAGAPVGMIDITDIVSLMPEGEEANTPVSAAQFAQSEDSRTSAGGDSGVTLPFTG